MTATTRTARVCSSRRMRALTVAAAILRSCAICWLVARPFFFRSATIRSSISSSVGGSAKLMLAIWLRILDHTRTPGFVEV